MLEQGKKLMAYPFEGYWKDVGTIESLWEANMDLLKDDNELNLYDNEWRIYSINPVRPAQYIGPHASVKSSLIVEGCIVHGEVENSVLFPGVFVGKNTVIKNSVIMPNTKIGENVIIDKAIVGNNVTIRRECRIGHGNNITVIPAKEDIKSGTIME